jgi:nitrate/nitrite transporter NarK
VGNISGIVAPLVTGILLKRTGSYYPGFVISVVILLAGVPVYWWLVKERKRLSNRTLSVSRRQ